MSPTEAGGKKYLNETEKHDFDLNNELDSDIKFDENDVKLEENDIKLEENEEEETNIIPIKSSEIVGALICEVCSKSLKSMKNLQKHMRIHLNSSFCCLDCGKIFDIKKKLTDHGRSHKTKQCSKCDKSVSKINIAKHEQTCQGPVQMLQCDLCPFQTKHANCLKKHKSKHSGHICELCGYVAKFAYRLKDHIIRCHPEGENEKRKKKVMYKCSLCNYQSQRKV